MVPNYRLKEEGAEVVLMGTSFSSDVVNSKRGYPSKIDKRGGQLKANVRGIAMHSRYFYGDPVYSHTAFSCI